MKISYTHETGAGSFRRTTLEIDGSPEEVSEALRADLSDLQGTLAQAAKLILGAKRRAGGETPEEEP